MRSYTYRFGRGLSRAGAAMLWLCCMFVFVSSSLASPPKRIAMDYLAVRFQPSGVSLALSVSIDGVDGLGELLKDGANVELKVEAVARQTKQFWVDSDLVRKDFTWYLSHDHLTREFILQSSQTPEARPLRDRNLERLLESSWQGLDLPLLSPSEQATLQKNKEYYVLLKLILVYSEIPPWLEKSPAFSKSQIVPKVEYTLPIFIPIQ